MMERSPSSLQGRRLSGLDGYRVNPDTGWLAARGRLAISGAYSSEQPSRVTRQLSSP